jgi:uncharacterized protein
MDMQASRTLAVTQQQAWDALNNPEVLKTCITGCDKVELIADNQYAVGVAVKIGPVSAKFAGKITLADINPPHSYTIGFDGQGGAAGFGKGDAKVSLAPLHEGKGCELSYVVHAQVGGKIAQLGQRLIDGVAKSMAEDFFKKFDLEMQRQYPTTDTTALATENIAASADSVSVTASNGSNIPVWAWILAMGMAVAAVLYFW